MPSKIGGLIALAIKVCAIDVLESISIAKALAYRNQYELKCATFPSIPPFFHLKLCFIENGPRASVSGPLVT